MIEAKEKSHIPVFYDGGPDVIGVGNTNLEVSEQGLDRRAFESKM